MMLWLYGGRKSFCFYFSVSVCFIFFLVSGFAFCRFWYAFFFNPMPDGRFWFKPKSVIRHAGAVFG